MLAKKIGVVLASMVVMAGMTVGCGNSDQGGDQASGGDQVKISISGSTSVGPAVEALAEQYQKDNEGVTVEVQQIGSSAGIKNAIDGITELGMSSRDLKDDEKGQVDETKIATDGIGMILNKSNEVKDLTIAQIKDIYTGKITNWKEVGGKDAPIVVCSREDGSGTRDGFQEKVGFESEELLQDAQISDGSGNIKSTVESNENAIGYISIGYIDDKVNCPTVDGVEATHENVQSGAYPISRPFLVVNKKGELSENAKKFLDYILSEDGQNIIADKGFVKIK